MSDALNVAAQWATIGAFLVAAVSLLVIAVQAWQYMELRRDEQKQCNFENYHRLIREVTAGKPGDSTPFAACQMAAVFELRNYLEYKEISRRVLEELALAWGQSENSAVIALLNEVDLTLTVLERK